MKCAELQNRDTRSDRQCDFPHTAGENEQSAQAVTVPLVSQKEAAEADQCGKRHSDLTGSVHVSFPQHFPPMALAGDDRFRSLREAFVVGGTKIGEKQEQSKNKIGVTGKIHAWGGGRGFEAVRSSGLLRRHCVEQVSLTPFIVKVALRPLIQNSMSASA